MSDSAVEKARADGCLDCIRALQGLGGDKRRSGAATLFGPICNFTMADLERRAAST